MKKLFLFVLLSFAAFQGAEAKKTQKLPKVDNIIYMIGDGVRQSA